MRGDERRLFALAEDNIYVKCYLSLSCGRWMGLVCRPLIPIIIGRSTLLLFREIIGWNASGELHLKTKMSRRFSSVFHLDMGVESYIRNYRNCYLYSDIDDASQMSPTISAGFFGCLLSAGALEGRIVFPYGVHFSEPEDEFFSASGGKLLFGGCDALSA